MKILFTFLLTTLFLINDNTAICQKSTDTTTKVVTITNMSLKDCYVTNKYIWILRGDGIITRINPETHAIYDSLKFNKKIVSIGKSINDTIYAADDNGGIFRIFDNKDTNFLWNTNQIVQNFVFTSTNKCFLITEKGIYEPEQADRLYYENAFSNGPMKHFNTFSWEPSSTFIDKGDNIWLGFSAGEWGGDIVIFSTNDQRFIKFRERQKDFCYVRPVRSFFQNNSNIYAVTSLQHMSSINSAIIEITDTCRYFFQSPVYKSNNIDEAENLYNKKEIYMGPAIFNSNDSSIYFYSQFGLFKGNIKKELSKLENWQLVLKTKFMWYYGMPDAVGYGMNVSKMFFEGNKLFIVSPSNGILIWDGKQPVLLKTTYKPAD